MKRCHLNLLGLILVTRLSQKEPSVLVSGLDKCGFLIVNGQLLSMVLGLSSFNDLAIGSRDNGKT
jgi:hypothetical protein